MKQSLMAGGWSRLREFLRPRGAPAMTAKASRAGPVIAYDNLGQPVWSPRDYAGFAREGFMQNAIVYRSVRMIAEAAASVPLLLYDGDVEIEAHPLLDLVRRPNMEQCAPDLFETFYGFLLVSGNGYIEAVSVGDHVRELHVLRPDRMKVVPGADGWPEAYEYSAGGRKVRFQQDIEAGVRPILHQRLFHPANDHYGMSPIEAAASAIDIHNAASSWNKALLDNSARPSGALVYAGRDNHLSDDQFDRLKRELDDGYQGAANAGRPMLLEGGLDWKAMSLSPKDMDFIEAKHVAAREIALALGVPPMLLGIPGDNTYSNFQEATRTLWRQTVLPLAGRTAQALSGWLGPAYGGGLELRVDLDGIEALAGEREALWTRVENASFLTRDEKRAAAGYGPIEGDEESGDGGGVKFNPNHDALGRFASGSGGGGNVHRVQARRGRGSARQPINIGSRTYRATTAEAIELQSTANRAQAAMDRVRQLDPDWRAPPSFGQPESIPGALSHFREQAQAAEARILVIERGGVPMGFRSAQEFEQTGQRIGAAAASRGHSDIEVYLRGSAVTGYSYREGRRFDGGAKPSDFDFALVSPSMLRRAQEIGVPMRGSGSAGRRSAVLNEEQMLDLGIWQIREHLRNEHRRPVNFMVYGSRQAIERRGPFLEAPSR